MLHLRAAATDQAIRADVETSTSSPQPTPLEQKTAEKLLAHNSQTVRSSPFSPGRRDGDGRLLAAERMFPKISGGVTWRGALLRETCREACLHVVPKRLLRDVG